MNIDDLQIKHHFHPYCQSYPLDLQEALPQTPQKLKYISVRSGTKKSLKFINKSDSKFALDNKLQSKKNLSQLPNQQKLPQIQTYYLHQYFPTQKRLTPVNRTQKLSKKHLQKNPTDDVIRIIENEHEQKALHEIQTQKDQEFQKYEEKSHIIDAYRLSQKNHNCNSSEQKKMKLINQSILNFPKIGKTQNLIQIIRSDMRMQRSKTRKKQVQIDHKKIYTIDYQINQNQPLPKFRKNTLQKDFSGQKEIFRSISENRNYQDGKSTKHEDQISSNRKHKNIHLLGTRVKPGEKKSQDKILNYFEVRTQRFAPYNLLSSQLIYKSHKQSIEKSVYQQLLKKR